MGHRHVHLRAGLLVALASACSLDATPTKPRDPLVTWATDARIERAVDAGDALFVALEDGTVMRVPKAGGPPTELTRLVGRSVRGLARATHGLVVLSFPLDPERGGVKKVGRIDVVPFSKGEASVLVPETGLFTEVVNALGAVWVLSEVGGGARLVSYAADTLKLAKEHRIEGRGSPSGLLGSDDRLYVHLWKCADSGPDKSVMVVDAPDREPRELLSFGGVGHLAASGKGLVLLEEQLRDAYAPGGQKYFEGRGGLRLVDPASGRADVLSSPFVGPRSLAAGPSHACVVTWDPSRLSAQSRDVHVVPLAAQPTGGAASPAIRGVPFATCLVVDAEGAWVAVSGKGLMRVPL